MIHGLEGEVREAGSRYLAIRVGGLSFKVFTLPRIVERHAVGKEVALLTYFHLRETAAELYGFETKEELTFFELLISISGVGPKSALSIMETAPLKDLIAAIVENRPDLVMQASGIGKKIAERIIVELRGKVASLQSGAVVERMERDSDLLETLMSLGFRRPEAKDAINRIPKELPSLEARLKEALRILHKK